MRKRTAKARRYRHHVKVLKSEVMSPRIAWFNFLGILKLAAKVALCISVLLGIAYGIRQAIEHTFHQNPDFKLQAISLNTNDVLDESALVEQLGIDLSGNIFDFDVDVLEQQLLSIPAISTARVYRNLPGTLEFEITTRKPVAWIACPEEHHPAERAQGNLLVDHEGFTYPCPPGQVTACKALPIVILAPDADHPVLPGRTLDHPQYRHCLYLLKAILSKRPDDIPSIHSISQVNEWSLNLTTRTGTVATFSLGDHKRQLDYLNRAMRHSREKGYEIATINLIPKQNVPITVFGDDKPPRAIPVQEEKLEEKPAQIRASRQQSDLRSLLNRN
jgi:hypothetical protein